MLSIFKNIKFLAGLGLVLILVTGGYSLYFHGKQVERLRGKIEVLEQSNNSLQAELKSSRIVTEILNEETLRYSLERKQLEKAYKDSLNDLKELKDKDEVSNDYLNDLIPERVRSLRERARCISMPYLCGEASGNHDNKN